MNSDDEMNFIEQEFSVMMPIIEESSIPSTQQHSVEENENHLQGKQTNLVINVEELEKHTGLENNASDDLELAHGASKKEEYTLKDSEENGLQKKLALRNTGRDYHAIQAENSELRELIGYLLPLDLTSTSFSELRTAVRAHQKRKDVLLKENNSLDTMIEETELSCRALLSSPNLHQYYENKQRVVEEKLAEAQFHLEKKSETIEELTKRLEVVHEMDTGEVKELIKERDELRRLLLQRENEIVVLREQQASKDKEIKEQVTVALQTAVYESDRESSKKIRVFRKLKKGTSKKHQDLDKESSVKQIDKVLLLLENQIKSQEGRFQDHLEEVRKKLEKEEKVRKRLESVLMEGSRLMNNILLACTTRLRELRSFIALSQELNTECFKQKVSQQLSGCIQELEKLKLNDFSKPVLEVESAESPLDSLERRCEPVSFERVLKDCA